MWKYIETVEKEIDLSGALRVRILCEKDGVRESFFLKFSPDITAYQMKVRINRFLERKDIEDLEEQVEEENCPNCGFNLKQ